MKKNLLITGLCLVFIGSLKSAEVPSDRALFPSVSVFFNIAGQPVVRVENPDLVGEIAYEDWGSDNEGYGMVPSLTEQELRTASVTPPSVTFSADMFPQEPAEQEEVVLADFGVVPQVAAAMETEEEPAAPVGRNIHDLMMSDDGQDIEVHLNEDVNTLDISGCDLASLEGIEGIEDMGHVNDLNVSSNALGDNTIDEIEALFVVIGHLTYLHLESNRFTEDGQKRIREICAQHECQVDF